MILPNVKKFLSTFRYDQIQGKRTAPLSPEGRNQLETIYGMMGFGDGRNWTPGTQIEAKRGPQQYFSANSSRMKFCQFQRVRVVEASNFHKRHFFIRGL